MVVEFVVKSIDVPDHRFFRKLTGEFVYKKISSSAVQYLGLDTERVYGVCITNGNIACMNPETKVFLL